MGEGAGDTAATPHSPYTAISVLNTHIRVNVEHQPHFRDSWLLLECTLSREISGSHTREFNGFLCCSM
jgi:hypothetical protein